VIVKLHLFVQQILFLTNVKLEIKIKNPLKLEKYVYALTPQTGESTQFYLFYPLSALLLSYVRTLFLV